MSEVLQNEITRLKRDILRVKLEREKLRLEKEQKIHSFEEFPWGVHPDSCGSAMCDWIAETLRYSVGNRVQVGTDRTDGLYKSYVDFCVNHNASALSLKKFVKTVADLCNGVFDVDDVRLVRMPKGRMLKNIGYRPKPSPVPPVRGKSFLAPAKYQYEIMRMKRDILRIKLEREKLRLEREKSVQKPQSFHEFCAEFYRKVAAAHGISLDQLKVDWRQSGFEAMDFYTPAKEKTRPDLQTFLCENCGEYVLVPTEGVGQKVRWKCMACYQENCFELSEE